MTSSSLRIALLRLVLLAALLLAPGQQAWADSAKSTTISPSSATQTASPGTTASYTHTITNLGPGNDAKNVTAISSKGWTVGLFDSSGTTTLADTDKDGIPDTGKLAVGASRTIVVKVAVPSGATSGTHDVLLVTATSVGLADAALATDTTTVGSYVKLSISTSTLGFGAVSPAGDLDPSISGITSTTDASGARYVRSASDGRGVVRVTVTSNGSWTGSCWAEENAGTASDVRVADGRLEWSLTGSGAWSPLKTSPDQACFTSRPSGTTTYGFDYRLHVNWTDDPGSVSSLLHFSVSP
jgi:hypothetical protein